MWLKEGANDYPGEVGGDLPLKAKILVFFLSLYFGVFVCIKRKGFEQRTSTGWSSLGLESTFSLS